jgi:hypothetical protein
MGVEFKILELAKTSKHYRLSDKTLARLEKLRELAPGKSDTELVQDAVAHLLGTLESDDPRIFTHVPSEGRKRHKDPHDAA